jgi:hypothetical protein
MHLGSPRPELTTYAGVYFTEFMRLIYLSRTDLQKRFSIDEIFNRTVLLTWYYIYASKDIKLFADDLPKPQWELLSGKCDETNMCEGHFLTKMQAVSWLASPLTKDCFDLNKLDDRLSIELLVSMAITKPEGVKSILPSARALAFADEIDPQFKSDLPIPVFRLISSIWKARKDIQNVFPGNSRENIAALVLWFLNHGIKELDISGLNLNILSREYLLSQSPNLHSQTEIIIPRVAHQIWFSNNEIQSRYDLHSIDGITDFLFWFNNNGITDYGLQWLYDQTQTESNALTPPISNKFNHLIGKVLNIMGNV